MTACHKPFDAAPFARPLPEGVGLRLWATTNSDPHTFDRTLLTLAGAETGTVALEDVLAGPVWVPDCGICVVTVVAMLAGH